MAACKRDLRSGEPDQGTGQPMYDQSWARQLNERPRRKHLRDLKSQQIDLMPMLLYWLRFALAQAI